ncbi:unnamed protein product [Symbiodinium sp. CCMP2592]|nr:unnamed protein product [Symbiodinium sp. CCMP2592]
MKVLTTGRMNEHSRKSHDDSQLLASQSLLRWPQTRCQARHACFVTCESVLTSGHLKTTGPAGRSLHSANQAGVGTIGEFTVPGVVNLHWAWSMWKQKRMLEHAWSWTSRGLRATSTTSHREECGTSAEQVQYIFSRPQNPAPVWPVMGDFGGCMDLGPTGGDV